MACPAVVTAAPSASGPCSLWPCAPCCYKELAVDALTSRDTTVGSGCATTAALSALVCAVAALNGVLARGAVTSAACQGAQVTAGAAALAGITADTLTATSLALNGVSALPAAAVVATTPVYTVPGGFAHNGILVVAPTVAQPLAVHLPAGAAVPAGYTLAVYNVGSTAAVVLPAVADPGVAFFGFTKVTAASVQVAAAATKRFLWTGLSWFIWT